jgi:glucan phosphoethanolaminetransferase (alkaline phosphatase superfamily)
MAAIVAQARAGLRPLACPAGAAVNSGAMTPSTGRSRRGALLAWASAVLFFGALAAANAVRVAAGGAAGDTEHIEAVVFGLAFFVTWVAAFGRVWPAVVSAFLLFAWWWPAELYLRYEYGTPLAPQFVGLALDSNLPEMFELVRVLGPEVLLGLVLFGVVTIPALVLCLRYPIRWAHRSRWWCLAAFPLAAAGMYAIFELQEPEWLQSFPDPFRVEPLAFWSDKWRAVFPATLPLAVARFQQDAQRVSRMREHIAGFKFGAGKALEPLDTVVLVIGESSRADRWSLNGYARKTNPLLERRPNLVFLSNVVTPSIATRYAVPFMLSRRPVLLPDGKLSPRPEPSLVVAFAEAGYRSSWISTQSPTGFWDSTTAFYARDAQTVRFVNPSAMEHRGAHDAALLEPMAALLRTPGPQLVVVHTMGSHFNYANRYPPAFDRFQPSLSSSLAVDAGPGRPVVEINNSYDNTIVYTDHVLDGLIAQLEQRGGRSVLAFVSDHGEDLAGPDCPTAALRREGRWSYRVPALIWMSDALVRDKPAALARIRARAAEPLQTDSVLPTLLEMAGVRIPEDGDSGNPGLLSSAPAAHARMVVGTDGAWTDFDAAERRGSCRIVRQ